MTAIKNLPRGAWAELDAAILRAVKHQRRQCLEDICSVSEVKEAFEKQHAAWKKLNPKRNRWQDLSRYEKVGSRLQALKKAGELDFCAYSRIWRVVL